MKTSFSKTILILILTAVSAPLAWAEDDLLTVYQQALENDPAYKKSKSEWQSAQLNLPLAKAGNGTPGSGLKPNISIKGDIKENYLRINNTLGSTHNTYPDASLGITITQPIFNYATWKSIHSAQYAVKAASAQYFAAQQDLIFRTARAYFAVLQAIDHLRYTVAQEKFVFNQLQMERQKFDAGIIPITGVYDAKASYDAALAQEIADQNAISNTLEDLWAITGKSYSVLKGLKKKIPTQQLALKPNDINQWVSTAEKQSYEIKASLNEMLSAFEAIKQAKGGRYPNVNATASYSWSPTGVATGAPSSSPQIPPPSGFYNKNSTANVGLAVNFPVYQGGYVSLNTKQKKYDYITASHELDMTHRNVIKNTRQSYLGVTSGIIKIRADEQSIISQKSQLEATKASYEVGTETMVDLLQSYTQLYNAQRQWADDRYNYITNILSLKKQVGTLSPEDLGKINQWLDKPISLTDHLKMSKK